jgi:hypothetical protein
MIHARVLSDGTMVSESKLASSRAAALRAIVGAFQARPERMAASSPLATLLVSVAVGSRSRLAGRARPPYADNPDRCRPSRTFTGKSIRNCYMSSPADRATETGINDEERRPQVRCFPSDYHFSAPLTLCSLERPVDIQVLSFQTRERVQTVRSMAPLLAADSTTSQSQSSHRIKQRRRTCVYPAWSSAVKAYTYYGRLDHQFTIMVGRSWRPRRWSTTFPSVLFFG